ncbi:MAG: hypothetical protein MI799_23955, partial [Desulfobacterales bacterium]|nr:hypothetical protein [Desulfobacterales bacterium]
KNYEDLMKAADSGVYAAKKAGKNCVRTADEIDSAKLRRTPAPVQDPPKKFNFTEKHILNLADDELCRGIQTLSNLSFPKICKTCGQRYDTVEEFISKTEKMPRGTGLKKDLCNGGSKIVALFRTCTCGSTLMDEFSDRRNLSKNGIKRRETFGALMQKLSLKGVSLETARSELLKIMRGEGNKLSGETSKV